MDWIDELDGMLEDIRKDISIVEKSGKSTWVDVLSNYFNSDHFPRYMDGWTLICRHIKEKNLSVLEIGPFPYFSHVGKKKNWTIKCIGLDTKEDFLIPNTNIFLTWGNLCFDDLGINRYDLIICTEVLEHLPCNLIKVRDKLIKALKPNGFMLMSYPLGHIGLRIGYDKDIEDIDFYQSSSHLREFPIGKAISFFNDTAMVSISSITSYPLVYPNGIHQILYKKQVM